MEKRRAADEGHKMNLRKLSIGPRCAFGAQHPSKEPGFSENSFAVLCRRDGEETIAGQNEDDVHAGLRGMDKKNE